MQQSNPERLSTGIDGLDEILCGGLVAGRTYMVRGGPGTGKTTLGLHFLGEAERCGEGALYITLGEAEAQIRANAASLSLSLQGVTFLDLSPSSDYFSEMQAYDIFSPAEVERVPTTQKILETVRSGMPQRVFLDAMTQFRYLARDPFQFRKQVLAFLRFLVEQGATVVFTSESSPEAPDDDLQFMADGVLCLTYDERGRSVSVSKLRGSGFRDGAHSLRLTGQGLQVFPRLVPDEYRREFEAQTLPSGIPNFDELLHGGLERGTVTIISGPTGVGKTTLGLQFMKEAAGRGETSVVYTFEEAVPILVHRCEAVNIPVQTMIERGSLSIVPVEPLRYAADEFAARVRRRVEEQDVRIVMIDSVSGYRLALRGQDLVADLHALCNYLKNMGVTVLLVNEMESIGGDFRATSHGLSYLADNIVFFRYIEVPLNTGTELRKVVGVLKKRATDFETAPREFKITRYGLQVGQPLVGVSGIVAGSPVRTRSDPKEER